MGCKSRGFLMLHCFNSRISFSSDSTGVKSSRLFSLSAPQKKATHFRINDEIYFHSESEFISFDWEHGVMENILMFYVLYIRKCYNPKNYIKYNTILAIIVVVDSCADATLCALLCVLLAVPKKRCSTILFSILWNIQQVKHKNLCVL